MLLAGIATMAGCASGGDRATQPPGSISSSATAMSTGASAPSTGDASSASETASPTNAATPLDEEAILKYLTATVSFTDPGKMREGLALTAEGSIAYGLLKHRADATEAGLDGGFPYEDGTVKAAGQNYKTCLSPSHSDSCATYSDFTANSDGKIVGFKIDGTYGDPANFISKTGKSVTNNGVTVTLQSARYSDLENVSTFVLKVETSKDDITINSMSSTYRTTSGKQRQPNETYGPTDLTADSNAMVNILVPGVKLGGTLALSGCVDDCTRQFEVTIPITSK
ncbi:hypothetical protein [Nostocoides vanveenii]